MKELQHFWDFMKRRHEAAMAFVSGDARPQNELSTSDLPATLFSMNGGTVKGHDSIALKVFNVANDYEPGGDSSFEILQLYAANGIGYWAGYQRATIWKRDQTEAEPLTLRVTEIYRREGNDWKLVHRHSDPLTTELSGDATQSN